MIRLLYIGYRIYCFIFRPITLGVRIMLIQNEQALLIRQTYKSGWFLPGGGVERGETLEQAARREAREEIGAELTDLRLIGMYTNFGEQKSDHNALFLCSQFSLSGIHDEEIAEARFFPLDALPAGLLPGHRHRLEEYRAKTESPQFGEW